MKKITALLMCVLLLLPCVCVQADQSAPFDPDTVGEQVQALLAENFPNIASVMTMEPSETVGFNFYLNSVYIGTLSFNHMPESGTAVNEGCLNHFALLLIVTGTDQETTQMFISLYAVLGGLLKHILHPELSVQDCASALITGLQNALNTDGTDGTFTAEEDSGPYHEIYSLSSLSNDMLFLGYQGQVIGLY